MAKKGTLFGKPKSSVIKHPGSFRAMAKKAGMSTAAFARMHAKDKGMMGRRARLAMVLMRMGKK